MSSQTATKKASVFSQYSRLFSFNGAKAFCVAGAIARLPMSMIALGIVLALNHLYNNWTIAGAMSASYVLAQAAVTPVYAKLFDRFGQRKVGVIALNAQVIAMISFACAALFKVPLVLLFVLAIVMGVTQFAFGALVRTRWAYTLRAEDDDSLLNVAYALESGIDEIVFILGPILAAWLATSVHPVSQLFVPVFASGLGGAWFFSLKNTQPAVLKVVEVPTAAAEDVDVLIASQKEDEISKDYAESQKQEPKRSFADKFSLKQLHNHHSKKRGKNVLLYRGIIPLVLMFVVFNMSFSAFDVSVTAAMKAQGLDHFIGMQLALFACGSLVGAIIFGSHKFRGSNWSHLIVFLTGLTVGFVLMSLNIDRLMLMSVFEVLSGLCVSPIFATGNLIVKATVPEESLTEGLSWLPTASAVGCSLGSMAAGAAIDSWNSHAGMMVPWISTMAAIPIATFGWFIVMVLKKRH